MTASRQSLDWELDSELHVRMDGCLAVKVTADQGRHERQLLPVIGTVWARKTTSASETWHRRLVSIERLKLPGVKRFDKIPTGGNWYNNDNIDNSDKLWRPLGQVGSFKNQFLLRSPWKPESRGTTRGILSSSRKRSDHSGLGGHTWFILLKFLAELISRI
ncbi:hypothetical protein V6N12_039345 [Hibiscus sabdariffa]|uniref:Uncharacterized protein n=1 Tax=Hibiscus sabdariffa TaxID=183260 RepID=A0ABR2E0Z4_9ROSI